MLRFVAAAEERADVGGLALAQLLLLAVMRWGVGAGQGGEWCERGMRWLVLVW